MFDEEVYYMLECASRVNADPEAVVKMCQEIQQERNKQLLLKFDNARSDPDELDIDFIDLDYSVNECSITSPALPEQ